MGLVSFFFSRELARAVAVGLAVGQVLIIGSYSSFFLHK